MDPLTPTTGYILQALQIPAVIACILCFKWRFLADYFFAAENFIQFVAILHLSYANYSEDFPMVYSRILGLWILLSISYRYEIILLALNTAFRLIMGIKIVYSRPLTNQDIVLYLLGSFTLIVLCTLGNMMLIFISELYQRLQVAEQASINLLNGMHEGILILSHTTSEESHNFLYCNKSAQKMIKNFVGPIEECQRVNVERSQAI